MGGGARSKRDGRAAASDSGRSSRSALHRSASARVFVSQPARQRPAADAVHQGIFGVSQVPGMPSKRSRNPPRSQGARTCGGRTQSSLPCRRSFSLALMSIKQDLEREGRTCKILEVEVKELRGEPQASTRGLTGVQCGRGEGCNAMSQQNLEEEVRRLWPNGLKKNEAAGYGQADCR